MYAKFAQNAPKYIIPQIRKGKAVQNPINTVTMLSNEDKIIRAI